MSVDSKSSYYDEGGIETIAVIKAKLTPEQYAGFLLGNIIKYSCRANHKGQFSRDIEKVSHYTKLLAEAGITSTKSTTPAVPHFEPWPFDCDYTARS